MWRHRPIAVNVKERFNPAFKRLDHHPLSLDERQSDGDRASWAAHILREARAVPPETDRVDLYETRGCGAVLTQGDTSKLIPV